MMTVSESTEATASATNTISATLTCAAETYLLGIVVAMDEGTVGLSCQAETPPDAWGEVGQVDANVGSGYMNMAVYAKKITTAGDYTLTVTASETVTELGLHLLEITEADSLANSLEATVEPPATASAIVTWPGGGASGAIVSREGDMVVLSVAYNGADTEITDPTGATLAQSTAGSSPFNWTLNTYVINAPKSDSYSISTTLSDARFQCLSMQSLTLSTLTQSPMLGVEF